MPAPLRILHDANHSALMQSGNDAYMHLFATKIRLESDLASKEYKFLLFTIHTMLKAIVRQLIRDLRHIIRDLSSKPSRHESRPNNNSISQFNSAPDAFLLIIPPPPSELDQEDYSEAKFWTQTDWQNYVSCETDRGNAPTKLGFLCDEEGNVVSKERIRKMTDTAKKIWGELHHHRYDPKTWRCVNLSANRYYTNHMCITF